MRGYMGRILHVDLDELKSQVWEFPSEVAGLLIGGKGLGIKLLEEMVPPGINPLGPENALIYVTGPLTGTPAPAMRGAVVTLSPLTGMFNDSYFGGHFSQELKYAGYDAVIFTGRAERPTGVRIDDHQVEFFDAAEMWGADTRETYQLVKDHLGDPSYRISCIGPAGENQVLYALVDAEPHRQAGRAGAGAVMGSKNLKAVAVRGTGSIAVEDPRGFRRACLKAMQEIRESEDSRELSLLSTASLVPFSNEYGFFPTRNFQEGRYQKHQGLLAERQDHQIWLRHQACAGCPIHCSKMGRVRGGAYAGLVSDNVEYETLGLLGGNLDLHDVRALAAFNRLADDLGLDTISLGAVLSFSVEAAEKGLISSGDLGGIRPRFGEVEGLMELARMIARREGLGDLLADGVWRAQKELGPQAEELAQHIQRLETPAWGPRGSYAMGLSYLTGDRGGCHQRGFPIAYEVAGEWEGRGLTDGSHLEDKALITVSEQDTVAALYCLIICDFGRSGISQETYLDLYRGATGIELSSEDLSAVGRRIWCLTREFNLAQGWTQDRAEMPPRFRTPLPQGIMAGHKFSRRDEEVLLAEYNQLRGWDEGGVPTRQTAESLQIPYLREMRVSGS